MFIIPPPGRVGREAFQVFAKDRELQSETVAEEQRLDERETQGKP